MNINGVIKMEIIFLRDSLIFLLLIESRNKQKIQITSEFINLLEILNRGAKVANKKYDLKCFGYFRRM